MSSLIVRDWKPFCPEGTSLLCDVRICQFFRFSTTWVFCKKKYSNNCCCVGSSAYCCGWILSDCRNIYLSVIENSSKRKCFRQICGRRSSCWFPTALHCSPQPFAHLHFGVASCCFRKARPISRALSPAAIPSGNGSSRGIHQPSGKGKGSSILEKSHLRVAEEQRDDRGGGSKGRK